MEGKEGGLLMMRFADVLRRAALDLFTLKEGDGSKQEELHALFR